MVTLSAFVLTKKSPSIIILLIGAVLALSHLDTCHAANTTSSGNSEAESMEKGMDFLFQMTKGFLDLIQPNRIYEKYNLKQMILDKNYEVELQDWRKVVLYFIGFAVCIAIGILFIIVMPIVGCCLCCCRTCCNNCGGKQHKHDPKNARYKRRCYTTFLIIFNTFILFAVVCTYVTNELYKKRFVDDPEIFNVVRKGTKDFVVYVDDSFQDLKTVAKKQVKLLETDIRTQLQNAGNKSVTLLTKNINVTSVMNEVEDFGNGVIELKSSLAQLSQSLANLSTTGSKLKSEVNQVKKDVLTKLSSCSDTQCDQLMYYINSTSVNAQFSTLDNQTDLLNELNKLLNIPNLAKEAEKKFDSVSKNITDIISKQNKTIEEGFAEVSNEMDNTLNDVTDIKKKLPTDEIDKEVNNAMNLYNSNKLYNSIPWYIGICVASILLMIVVCNYLGILFGLCGERPGENAPCCNRGIAANFLLAGVGFYFIFCWILVIIVLIEFVVGGIMYTEVCRYLNKDNPTELKPILNNFNFTYPVLNKSVSLATYDIIDKCYKNNSLLNSINFPKTILTDNIPTKMLVDKINSINENSVHIGDVKLLDDNLEKTLKKFENLKTNNINLTQYEIQLNKTVVTTDLNLLAHNLTNLGIKVNISFVANAQKLREIHDTTYTYMKNEMNNLGRILVLVKKNMNLDKKVSSLITTIKKVEISVKNNGTELIKKIVKEVIQELGKLVVKNVNNLIDTVINNVAPCRPVYNIIFAFTDVVCITFLNPMNGFWFSTGWAIFFFLPTIIFATKLAGLYRCWYKRPSTQENADSYAASDADHIPLARVNQGKSSPQGMPNSAYDDIPSNKYNLPPNQVYNYNGSGNPYSGYPVYPPPSYHDTRMNPGRY